MMNKHAEKEYIIIFTGKLARKLLKMGFTIVDIKPDKEKKDKTLFVFKKENDIEKHIKE